MSTYTTKYGTIVRELKTEALGKMVAADILIGMDVMSLSDFKFTNKGETVLSICTPSEGL